MTVTTKAVTWKNGKRVETIEQALSKFEDFAKMGDLYYRLADFWRMMEREDAPEEDKVLWRKEIAALEEQIQTQGEYLAGYASEEREGADHAGSQYSD